MRWWISENAFAYIVGFFHCKTWIFGAWLPRTSIFLEKKTVWGLESSTARKSKGKKKWSSLRKRETFFKKHVISHFSLSTTPTHSFIDSWQLQDDNQQINTWAQLTWSTELITVRRQLFQFHWFAHHCLMYPKRLQLQGFYMLSVQAGNLDEAPDIPAYFRKCQIPTHLSFLWAAIPTPG